MPFVENKHTSKYSEMNLRIIKGKSNEDKILAIAGQFKQYYCLMNLKNSGDLTGFEPMTSVMSVL